MNFLGIVDKPRFDTEFFKIGKAIHISKLNNEGVITIDYDAIITDVKPLEMEVIYYTSITNNKTRYSNTLAISIEDVIEETVKIADLKRVEK